MDDEDAFLAALSDDDWAKRARRIEREFARDQRRLRRRRRLRRVAAVLVPTLVLGTLGVGVLYMLAQQGASDRRDRADQVPVLNSLAPTRTSEPPAAPQAPPDPFALTPAAAWPNADVGVIMPAATPMGPLSQDEVQERLDQAHQFLVAAKTDPVVLVAHDLSSIDAMTNGEQRTNMEAAGMARDAVLFGATLLAEGTTLTAPIRVNGTVTAQWVEPEGPEGSHLLVQSNLVWAYALSAPEGYASPNTVTVVHETRDVKFYVGPSYDGGVWISQYQWFGHNIDCAHSVDGLLRLPRPKADVNRNTTGTASPLPTTVYYDPRTDLDTLSSTC